MHTATGKGVFEDCEHGEVVARIEDRVRAEEETGVISMFRSCTGRKIDFLQACFFGVEELLQDERIFFGLARDFAPSWCVQKRLWDGF